MRKKARSFQKQQSLSTQAKANEIKLRLKFSPNPKIDLFRLKISTRSEHLFEITRAVLGSPKYYDYLYGSAFPASSNDIWSKPFLYQSGSHLQEIIWSICRCLHYTQELLEFRKLQESFELSIVNDEPEAANLILTEIERQFGCSLWLIQAKLAIAMHWGEISELTRQTDTHLTGLKANGSVATLIWFFRRRIEASSDNQYLKSELAKALSQISNQEVHTYFETKLFDLQDVGGKSIASTLLIEAQMSVIDLYDTLVLVLQSVASMNEVPAEVSNTLRKPIKALFDATGDSRLPAVVRALGLQAEVQLSLQSIRAAAIEAYTTGDYENCISHAAVHLGRSPGDMSTFVLLHKAAIQAERSEPEFKGILRKISKNLLTLLRLSDGAYTAAHEILQLSGRFYGQSWMDYLRASTLYELRQEKAEFPPVWMRDMYVRDAGQSPFTAVAISDSIKSTFLDNTELRQLFPRTLAAYYSVTAGLATEEDEKSPRHLKYLARYELSFGDASVALANYRRILETAKGADRVRCAGGLALAYLKLGDIGCAASTIIDTYIANPAVPGSLPIADAANALGDPANWPDVITIPILLSLYLEYVGTEKLATLRFAFEKFQLRNNINIPDDLFSLGINEEHLLLYLNRVWRPEVMRQTILYDSSRQVEEARIKVCQTLAERDNENEGKYLDEIKERVKRLAIAKGIKLVEQSKVYVDIPAIKKEVIKRLDSPYKRYKASHGVDDSDKGIVIERVVEALTQSIPIEQIPKALSGLHFIGEDKTEGGAQFDAMYAEITNEFLRGAHGLNAYLSTRIRHGVLSNFLRKPVEDERLVTSREEGKSSYVKNDYWSVALSSSDATNQNSLLHSALNEFSQAFDAVLDDLRDNLLQIRIDNNIIVGGKESALFIYGSSNAERIFLKAQDRHGKDLDQFVDRCVEHLWAKTDQNLERVQFVLGGQIKQQLLNLFDHLGTRVSQLSWSSLTSDIGNAIARAKTDTQSRLITVISWFKRSEVYDRQDFTPEFLVEVAHNMIKNTISSAANWEAVHVTVSANSEQMPGRTLDGMVYAFYGLLENAIKRSNIPVSELVVRIDLSVCDGNFKAKISNNIDLGKISNTDREKLIAARTAIADQESTKLAQREGLSGLHKIWLAANGPFYSSPKLEFDIENDQFVVQLQFNMERSNHEVSNN